MPDWMPALFLFVFVTHMPFFAWRYRKTREIRHAATALTFALLAIVYALRVFAQGATCGGVPLYRTVQVPAWISAAISIGLLLRHHLARLR
jgi:hypothetical protein